MASLLRRFLPLAPLALVSPLALLGLAGCSDSGGQSITEPSDALYAGTRAVIDVEEGAGTCLGQYLATRSADAVELRFTSRPGMDFFATLEVSPGTDSCIPRGDREGAEISWYQYRCTEGCWWELFECEGRLWSMCRGGVGPSTSDFHGSYSSSTITGTERLRFRATDGTAAGSHEATARFVYTLMRR